tara:strand:- start:1295 stop:1579 length:285 start_codon:yes stop_codon:yes gene_type:complete
MTMDEYNDQQIRKIILAEYYKREKGVSKNPEMHIYNFPELKKIDNEKIFQNTKYLMDENLVRGGIDEEGDHAFPWITKLTSMGIEWIEKEQSKA